ncbi:hypothetical protein KJ596_01805 [Patescibacteria group bacterium]|nr:hypothetical protein [Patescibacteria group bacterium]MBU1868200.1 hypothetical protein [Patescibacteria group bacterium]
MDQAISDNDLDLKQTGSRKADSGADMSQENSSPKPIVPNRLVLFTIPLLIIIVIISFICFSQSQISFPKELLPTNKLAIQELDPEIPTLEELLSQVVTDYRAINSITLESNTSGRMKVSVSLDASGGQVHSLDSLLSNWDFVATAREQACYWSKVYDKDNSYNTRLTVTSHLNTDLFPDSAYCSNEGTYNIEIEYALMNYGFDWVTPTPTPSVYPTVTIVPKPQLIDEPLLDISSWNNYSLPSMTIKYPSVWYLAFEESSRVVIASYPKTSTLSGEYDLLHNPPQGEARITIISFIKDQNKSIEEWADDRYYSESIESEESARKSLLSRGYRYFGDLQGFLYQLRYSKIYFFELNSGTTGVMFKVETYAMGNDTDYESEIAKMIYTLTSSI